MEGNATEFLPIPTTLRLNEGKYLKILSKKKGRWYEEKKKGFCYLSLT